jgi:hypothetical protein
MVNAKWVGSPHHSSRHGHRIQAFVIHVTEGTIESVDDWFNQEESQVSAHYAILKDGDMHQYVKEEDAAWHAGRVDHPTAKLVLDYPGLNPNLVTLGIEHEGHGDKDFTEKQYETSSTFIADRADHYGIPVTSDTVIGHHSIFSKKTCPGPVSLDRLIKLAASKLRPKRGAVRWSDYFKSNIILEDFRSNEDWTFRVPGRGTFKAQALWSVMQPARQS